MKKAKIGKVYLAATMVFSTYASFVPVHVSAAAFSGSLSKVDSVTTNQNTATISFNDGAVKGRITFLENDIFRYNVDPTGEFKEYATPRDESHKATIQAQSDQSSKYTKPNASYKTVGNTFEITANGSTIILDKNTAKMSIKNKNGVVVMNETAPLSIGAKTVQSLAQAKDENFFGGGTQNGRFTHKGQSINIVNESGWTDGGVSSPNPFYWSSKGYGVLRNTFAQGYYNFGKGIENVTTTHNESEFDAYYFVSNDDKNISTTAKTLLNDYYKVTGNPVLLPEYAFYLAHLNCYNRDGWEGPTNNGWTLEDGKKYNELGKGSGYVIPEGVQAESLVNEAPTVEVNKFKGKINNDTYKFSAKAVVDGHVNNDMPLGWFLPNDGYGCGYGQNGYYEKRTNGENTDRMNKVIDANVANLKKFTDYAKKYGIRSGLWTQAALTPEASEKDSRYEGFQTLRDFKKEVHNGGVSALKTDVAWVGAGYSMALNSVMDGYRILAENKQRPTLVSLDGWAGFQRYASIWTGDQTGGNWEYIRFHIPTYIGQSLSGNPNIGSDVDGIFGGSNLITTRDLQFKTFTQTMLDMDGWGALAKKPYNQGNPYTSINRMYLKLKSQLMPYLYTYAHKSVDGLPMIRAMFLEEANDYTYGKGTQYQFMYGDNFLVAPVYQDTQMNKETGDDIRNNIYLPKTADTWIDYFTGKQYRGGQVLNNFDAPLWKLPLFVKNGSIIPMYEENNNPMAITKDNAKGLDKTRRIVEFYPYKESDFDLIEDDGISMTLSEDGTRNYGEKVTTHMTSSVKDGKATLTIDSSKGTYTGYNPERHTTFVVNVSEEPKSLEAFNGGEKVNLTKVSSYSEFETKAKNNEAVWFYDTSPNLNKYSKNEEAFKNTKITTTPKLYVSFTKTDVSKYEQKLVIDGFKNDSEALNMKDVENPKLSIPQNVIAPEETKTPKSILVSWNDVKDATSYEIMVDGVLNTVGTEKKFNHADLDYHSTHTYKVRARNVDGYSKWSNELTTTSLEDPWRNVPKSTVTFNGGDQWGKLVNATDHNYSTMFHSTGDVVTNAEPLILDLGNGHQLDKFVYTPRGQGQGGDGPVGISSNGTVSQMDVFISLDGKHWEKVHEGDKDVWSYKQGTSVLDNQKTVKLDGKMARYVKLIVTKSNGNFFAANELAVYKKDGTNAFAVGSIAPQGREEVTEDDFTNLNNYKGLSIKDNPTFNDQVKKYGMDINMNDVYDVYDYTYTLFKLDGGTKKTGSVSGNALLIPSANKVKSGETFTIDVYADNVKNMNAIGQVINYDPNAVEFVNTKQSPYIMQMTDLTKNQVYTGVKAEPTAYVNLAYVNRGNQELYSGTGIVATITMKAKTDLNVAEKVDLNKVTMVGPEFNQIITDVNQKPQIPDVPVTTTKEYTQQDFNITMTNDELKTDNGENVKKMVQGQSYDSLFNGTSGREFEFKYSTQPGSKPNSLPAYVKLPTTMHFEFKQASPLTNFVVRNADSGTNGFLTSVKAVITFEDNSKQELSFDKEQQNYDFKVNSSKSVKKVDIEFVSSKGEAELDTPKTNRMLTLGEIDFFYTKGNPVTSIKPADDTAKQVYIGYLKDVKAVILPEECPNKFFTATSSHPEIATIVTLPDANGHPIYKVRGVSKGTATITLASAADPNITTSYTIEVLEGADKTELVKEINKYKELKPAFYQAETYMEFKEALTTALELNKDEKASRADIDQAILNLKNRVRSLMIIPVSDEKVLAKTVKNTEALYSESNKASNMFDNDLSTFWESPYSGENVGLPKDVVMTLDKTYLLEQLTFVSHVANNGGITDYTVSVSMDGINWLDVTSGLIDSSQYFNNKNVTVNARFSPVKAKFVKLMINGAVGRVSAEDNQYARIAELKLFGSVNKDFVDTSKLQKLVQNHKDKVQGNYTDASWAIFKNALIDAENVLKKENPTQEEVEKAYGNLESAINGLTESSNPNKPEEPNKPEKPINPIVPESGDSGNNNHNNSNQNHSGVPTGDTTNTTTLFFLLFLSSGVFMLKRKKN